MLPDLDQTLKQLLIRQVPLDAGEVEVAFELPSRDWSGGLAKPTLNLYLYDIRENRDLRDNDWIVRRGNDDNTATKRRPPLRIDLSYLVTAWTAAVEDEHRLLWRVLAALLRHPVLPRDILQGELKETVERLDVDIRTETAQPDGVFKDPGDFWTAIDNQLKPAINYVVTVPLDLEAAYRTKIVIAKRLRVPPPGPGAAEELIQVAGTVRADGKPDEVVVGATVSVVGRGLSTETDDAGRYTFRHLPAGKHTLRVSAPNRKAKDVAVTVPDGSYDVEL
jgi:hypothetical protein